ncbi:ImmA/IrrE family metallo-endopeptidase [Candidatus Nitrotoga arctica]|uniref:Peptidase family M48 n=1 Tax=Candidatus Nitrotoga arctica TaxID=453162 RepID=A0ABN8AH28_9PROT|nr:hypothetical protein [Candidatus Nitrotoga arctica]CAG9932034.1 conserved protein of unknown function [Candidatus Nitrotoga arctica]
MSHYLSSLGLVSLLICLQITVSEAKLNKDIKDVVITRGLRHTNQDQQIVAKAIERANLFLEERKIRLSPSWSNVIKNNSADDDVSVYLVEKRGDDTTTPAWVPKDCHCVFVNPKFLASWAANNSKGIGRMSIDREYFLTYILLHEVGHISKHTSAKVFDESTMNLLNIDKTKEKANEEDADKFAAELLRKYSRQSHVNSASLEANWVISELSKLSWNMQAFRTLDEFGAFALGKPSVYFDNGYSHPNLAWRILKVNYLIQQTEATQALLNSFEEARQRGANPEPLYNYRE